MLSLLADALMIATRLDPMPKRQSRSPDDWSERFTSARMHGLEETGRRFNAKRDLNW